MVQQVNGKSEVNGVKDNTDDYIGVGDEHALSFDIKDVIDLAVEGVMFNSREKSQNGSHIQLNCSSLHIDCND